MTREEAIEVLENGEWWEELAEWYMIVHPEHDKLHDAVDMAISAIRQKQTITKCNDLYDEDGGEILPKSKRNEPLTLDELRQMDGEPVYCVEITGREEWLFRRDGGFADMYGEFTSDDFMSWDNYGKLWWCYRQKPEAESYQ